MSELLDKEVFRTLCGRQIGGGAARAVYECALDPALVVKIENEAYSFQNVSEWELWQKVEHHVWASQLFAPCVQISPSGVVLIQKRTTRPRSYPDLVPAVWTDLKLSNYGMLDGRLVCHDYGLNMVTEYGLGRKPVYRPAKWWDLDDETLPEGVESY